jgi:hypothetical protein
MVTESDVISILQTISKPLKAREIAASLERTLQTEVKRSEVNQILYRLKERGIAVIDDTFRWQMPSGGSGAGSKTTAETPDRQRAPTESYYDVLQVTKNAHPSVIMKAYKALVTIYHPDRSNPAERANAEERMKLINIAYETLSDSRKRAEYDKNLGE